MQFQSLLHQGISLLAALEAKRRKNSRRVSIPSSSGHQFTARRSQKCRRDVCTCFNPFFIRASVYCHPAGLRASGQAGGFQSLLHQGISLLVSPIAPSSISIEQVSIPSSSGHQFTARPASALGASPDPVSIPSSSGHQFTAWNEVINELLDQGVSIPSSSGHQFTAGRADRCRRRRAAVSIPSSSGHQFTD